MNKKELAAVYIAGLLQGIVLVAFPAISSLLTSADAFALSATQYGLLFLPQSVLSIFASLLSAKISQRLSLQFTFVIGLTANTVAMALLALSALVMHQTQEAYPLLLTATAFLGIGFGLTVPTLNTLAELLRPNKVDTVVLVLNALLGTGTVLAPLLSSLFIGYGMWWGLPLLLIASLTLLIVFSRCLAFPKEESVNAQQGLSPFPKRALLFMAAAIIYGYVETLNGNWAAIYMREVQAESIHFQSFALTLFWGLVTIGRVFFASASHSISRKIVYQWLPLVVAIAFVILGFIPRHSPYQSLGVFALAGFGCSALLPLTISFGGAQLQTISRSVAGIVVALYLLGYGIASFLPGFLIQHTPYSLSTVFSFSSLAALLLAVLAFFINRENGPRRVVSRKS